MWEDRICVNGLLRLRLRSNDQAELSKREVETGELLEKKASSDQIADVFCLKFHKKREKNKSKKKEKEKKKRKKKGKKESKKEKRENHIFFTLSESLGVYK